MLIWVYVVVPVVSILVGSAVVAWVYFEKIYASFFRSTLQDLAVCCFGIESNIKIHNMLGKGSNGIVYRAEWYGQMVAVKITGTNEPYIPSFNHHNTVRIYTWKHQYLNIKPCIVNMFQREIWIVQEYCDLGNLSSFFHKYGLIVSPEQKLDILRQIGHGLEHVHDEGYIHGDIHPQNILLKTCLTEPFGYTVKIADYGKMQHTAHVIERCYGNVSHTSPESMIYQTVSQKCDIFAFGILAWEIYNEKNLYRTLEQVFEGTLPEYTDENIFQKITAMCCVADPNDRPEWTVIRGVLHSV